MQPGVKVGKKEGEKTRRKLASGGLLDPKRKILKEGDYLIFPIKGDREKEIEDRKIVWRDFATLEKRKNFSDYLKEFLTRKELLLVRTSFDVIGDIAIIEIPPELEKHQENIAKSLLKAQKGIKTVFKKSSKIRGDKRVRGLRFLAGEDKSETVHKESGMRLKLDVTRVYFSPRLSRERERILEQTEDGETVVDLFAGIGPFSLLLARNRDVKIYTLDINPDAVMYLKENIALNKVEDRIIPILGDAREMAPVNSADRVIMNLPKSSDEFLELAFDVIKKGIIHFYTISPEEKLFDSKTGFIYKTAKKKDRKIQIKNKKIVRNYSPRSYHIVFDIEVF